MGERLFAICLSGLPKGTLETAGVSLSLATWCTVLNLDNALCRSFYLKAAELLGQDRVRMKVILPRSLCSVDILYVAADSWARQGGHWGGGGG